ncbi:hypothetical protein E2C01_017697 [Portunus trituberculatus]|uniref:Uncharacterized protein n=1 Tax=Portunus trituberculatus TaxID=210409 RepID=A0A5B7DU83_PORTR|nr:hypothetical protein [Portunus trituberculatus]
MEEEENAEPQLGNAQLVEGQQQRGENNRSRTLLVVGDNYKRDAEHDLAALPLVRRGAVTVCDEGVVRVVFVEDVVMVWVEGVVTVYVEGVVMVCVEGVVTVYVEGVVMVCVKGVVTETEGTDDQGAGHEVATGQTTLSQN